MEKSERGEECVAFFAANKPMFIKLGRLQPQTTEVWEEDSEDAPPRLSILLPNEERRFQLEDKEKPTQAKSHDGVRVSWWQKVRLYPYKRTGK